MKRRFTILTAALALLTFLAVPMGMRGQSRESITVSYGWEDADDANQWTISSAIEKTSGQGNTGTYAGKISTNTTTVQYNDKVNVTSFSYAFKRTSNNSNYSVNIQTSTDGETWNTVDNQTMGSFNNGTYKTVTKTFDGNTAYYVRLICNNTTAVRYVDDVTIVYNTTASTTFTVNYDCNGGETDCPENVSGIAPGTSITLASAPSRPHYNFVGWTYGATTYNPGDSYTVNSNVTFVAQWEPDGTYGEGSICFSNQSSCTAINSQSVTGEDDLGNTWTITTVGTSSFTSNSGYYQVGSGNSPATSITFTTTLDEEVNVTDFSAMFGGFSATRASVVLKVDDTQVGSGTLNGAADVTVSSSSAQIGTTLTVIVTPTAGGVKCYNISYAYETIDNPAVATTTTINVPQNFNTDIYQGTTAGTLTATVKDNDDNTVSGATVTWSSSNTGVATIDANGAVTLVAVGTTTITANYAGVEDEYRPSEGTYELTVTDSNAPGTQNNPYTVAQARAAIDAGTGTQGVYATGIVCTASSNLYQNKYLSYYISADGSTESDQLEAYNGLGIDGASFASVDDVQVGDVVVIYGNLTKYNSTYEFAANNQLVSLVRPARITVDPTTIDAPYTGEEGSLTMTYENIEEFTSFDYYFCDVVGNELEEDPNWIVAEIQEENDNYSLYYIIDANDGAARTAYLKVYTFDDELEEVYVIVTVNQAFAPDPSITIANATVNVDASEHVGTLALSYENLPIIEMEDFDVQYYDAEGEETSEPDWIEVLVAEVEGGNGYEVSYYMVENEGETRTVYFKVYSLNAEAELVYSNLVTISQEEAAIPSTGDEWVLTNLADLTADDVFVIVGDNGDTYAMSNDNGTSSAPSAVAVTVDGENNKLTSTIGSNIQWNLEITNDGFIFHPNGTTSTWLYCTNSNDGVRVGTGDAKHFNFDENYTNYLTITETNDQRFIGIYNSQDWRCYKLGSNNSFPNNIADQTFAFYKKVSNVETYETTITPNTMTGWHLIASPLAGSVKAGDVENLKSNDYDLYSFDQSKDKEWQNYKKHGFYLESGKGYLYANSGTVTLTFTGVPYSGDGEIELDYSETNENSNMRGLNLIGNPYNANTTIDSDREFYIMNSTGTQIIVADNDHKTIAPMQGIFVKAEGTGETVTFTPATQGSSLNNNSSLVLNLIQNRGDVIDRAIVRLGNGGTLPKIQLFENSTKLYISQYNEDYAVVKAEAQGEMPVNFRAAENGTYTLSIDAENVEMNYLHLIDNMTGMDIDLLQTPSYTFSAATRDYESRFKLVFAANGTDEADESSFAFFSNGNLIVNNEGNATLQVIDINGRILSSETISGSCSKAINATTGVYMLRLINGDNVKVQKVVVR